MADDLPASKPVPESHPEGNGTFREITRYAREKITWVRSAYKFAGALVAIVFVIGVAFTYKSSSDFRNETRQETEKLTGQMLERLATTEASMRTKVDAQIAELSRTVQLRVEQEFRADNIQRLVETKARERIDATADALIKDSVSSRITPLRDEITVLINKIAEENKQKVALLDQRQDKSQKTEQELRELLDQARETLSQVRQQSDFVQTVLAAQSDDRKAYDQLCAWATNAYFSLRTQSEQAKFTIQKSYSGWLGEGSYADISWKDGINPAGMSFQEIEANWQLLPPIYARAYVDFVWSNTNITKEQKITFIHGVLADSRNSMQAADKAGRILADESKTRYNPPFEFGPLEKWWADRMASNTPPEKATNKVSENDVAPSPHVQQ